MLGRNVNICPKFIEYCRLNGIQVGSRMFLGLNVKMCTCLPARELMEGEEPMEEYLVVQPEALRQREQEELQEVSGRSGWEQVILAPPPTSHPPSCNFLFILHAVFNPLSLSPRCFSCLPHSF